MRAATELGTKVTLYVKDGFPFIDRLSRDSYNGSLDLPKQIEVYCERLG
jgi:hypothetical protein